MVLNVHRRRDCRRTMHVVCVDRQGNIIPEVFYADGRRKIIRRYLLDESGHKYLTLDRLEAAKVEERRWFRWKRLKSNT